MAFCNSCGGALEAGAKFCPKCGSAVPASTAASAPPAPAAQAAQAAPAKSSGALKIILIILAVIIGLGILGAGTAAYFVHRAVSKFHVDEKNGNVHVETPFGSVESSQDPAEAAKSVGVELYPGATMAKDGSANMTIAGVHTASVELETSDSPSAVNDFYKSKFPKASMMSAQGDHYTIMTGDKNNLTTITIEPEDGMTHIHISKVTGKMMGMGRPTD
jgi:flagellar basal body-associated protein FliL